MTPPRPLLSVRAALVLLSAFVIGFVAGVLAYLGYKSVPVAALIGGSAAGGGLALVHGLVERR